MLSAFARLLATVLSRTDCADIPEPAISNTLNEGMSQFLALLAGDRGHQAAELRLQKSERGLEADRVLSKRGLLHLHVDGVAIERRGERRSVFEIGGSFRACGCVRAAEMGRTRHTHEYGCVRVAR